MRSYFDEKLLKAKDKAWVESINRLRKFSNSDPDAQFHLHYIQIGKRKEQCLSFNTLERSQEDGKDYYTFLPDNIKLLDIEIKDFNGENYPLNCYE